MIDFEMVDRFFDAGAETGVPFQWALFDRRMLLPLSRIPDGIKMETDENITIDGLRERQNKGWFDLLTPEGSEASQLEPGVPLYVPSRIGLFLKLERDGVSDEELREVVAYEEGLVSDVLTTDQLQYHDDDIDTLLCFWREKAAEHQVRLSRGGGGPFADGDEQARALQQIEILERFRQRSLNDRQRQRLARSANRVRALNDMIRLSLIGDDRAKLKAGYTINVQFSAWEGFPEPSFDPADIEWTWTIRQALSESESGPRIRLPGFVLLGDRILTTRTMPPPDYQLGWRTHGLDDYLKVSVDLMFEGVSSEFSEGQAGRRSHLGSARRRHRLLGVSPPGARLRLAGPG